MNTDQLQEEYERKGIFTRWAGSADKVEVRRLLPNRKYKYLGRILRDEVERDPGVVAQRFGGGVYRLQIVDPGNKDGRTIEAGFDAHTYGPPRDDAPWG